MDELLRTAGAVVAALPIMDDQPEKSEFLTTELIRAAETAKEVMERTNPSVYGRRSPVPPSCYPPVHVCACLCVWAPRAGLSARKDEVEQEVATAYADLCQSRYVLHAVIAHDGAAAQRGHYLAYRRWTNSQWLRLNDTAIAVVRDRVPFEGGGMVPFSPAEASADGGWMSLWVYVCVCADHRAANASGDLWWHARRTCCVAAVLRGCQWYRSVW